MNETENNMEFDMQNQSDDNAVVDNEKHISDDISERFNNVEHDIMLAIEGKKEKKIKKSRAGHIEKIIFIIIVILMFAAVCTASVYCIILDIKDAELRRMEEGAGRPGIMLNTAHRPDMDDELVDENGRYTVEGIAKLIRPQIVEIYTYAKKDSDVAVGSGSGIIISEDGYIVTNTHVLDGNERYVVNTYNGKSYDAEITGRDAKTDIAVIKIKAKGLSAAQFGNSNDVVQGESVVAIGNPAGLTGSITDGIVSGLNRKIKTEETGFEMNCIQTNAAISPGNSGGALVNMYGQVIGITSSKYAAATTEGLGFAITINDALPIIEELISKGYVSGRVRVGITFYTKYAGYSAIKFKDDYGFDIPKELEESLWIEEVSKDCDISNTELKAKDFIVSVEGRKTSDYSSLSEAIKGKKGGDTVKAHCARVSEDSGKIKYFDIEFKLMEDKSGNF